MTFDYVSVAAIDWKGNDGYWSTFGLSIGTPPQSIEVFPATSLSAIWAVLPNGCWNQNFDTLSQCTASRGQLFRPNSSSTHRFINGSSWDSYRALAFPSESRLFGNYSASQYQQSAILSLENVLLGVDNPINLTDTLVESYAAKLPYLGLLGLRNYQSIFTDLTGVDRGYASVLTSINTSGTTVSASWAYTAGFYNQDGGPYFGSLIFGGYDAARGNGEDRLTIGLRGTSEDDTSLYLDGIYVDNPLATPASADGLGLRVYIDSVVPEMWLPSSACAIFERAFGLVWNSQLELYLISDSQHHRLLEKNATVQLQLSASLDASKAINISLPYVAFWQPISFPLAHIVDNTVLYYFPLKRASNDPTAHQWFLGRVFLQAAYMAVDYDRNEFYVSQALFPDNSHDSNIQIVYPPGVKHHTGAFITHSPKPAPLSTGAIAGIAIGGAALLAIIIALLWWFFYYRPRAQERMSRRLSGRTEGGDANPEFTGYYGGGEEKKRAEEEMYEKRELEAADANRASVTSRHEMPSPPPLPQYSPGSRSPGSPGSPGSHMRNISAESAELPGDYLTARRLSPVSGGPWELPGSNDYQRGSSPTSPGSPLEMGIGSLRGPNPATNF